MRIASRNAAVHKVSYMQSNSSNFDVAYSYYKKLEKQQQKYRIKLEAHVLVQFLHHLLVSSTSSYIVMPSDGMYVILYCLINTVSF